MSGTSKQIRLILISLLTLTVWTCSFARASWFDSAWPYRRSISIAWDDQNPTGEDLASCVFYTDGHALPNGDDIRVATEDGKLVASHVLMTGPGDRVRVVFAMQKGVRDYQIYFGNPAPPAPAFELSDVRYKSGLLLETRAWTGGATENFDQLEKSWERSKPVLGKMMTDSIFLGYNPFGPQEQWISKFNGSLFAPLDGDYIFAMAADDDASLSIDGKQTLFAPLGGGDARYHTTVHLVRGRHDLLVYHVNKANQGYVSLGWRTPDSTKFQIIQRQSFGICYSGLVGLMEQHNKTLVADFSSTQVGECFFGDSYSFHYHFATKSKIATKYEWDFGDGQKSSQAETDHVYLSDGLYKVKLILHAGENVDTQTCALAVGRNYAHILDSRQEQPQILSSIMADDVVDSIPPEMLSRLLQLHLAADHLDAAALIAEKVAALKSHSQPDLTLTSLNALQRKLIDAGQVDKAVAIWDQVPIISDLQPQATKHASELAMWWTGDFGKAVKVLKPIQEHADPQTRRLFAQAQLLSGHVEAGQSALESMNSTVPANRRAALSGAAARTVEFFITTKDPESGEEAWDRWQQRFPSDFLEGYSVVLRTKLMVQRNRPQAAAKLAEAFALAIPKSPYAPQLLDSASKLLATTDATKSLALRQLLKQKYPEDPLSQN